MERETKQSNEAAAKEVRQLSITSVVKQCDPTFVTKNQKSSTHGRVRPAEQRLFCA